MEYIENGLIVESKRKYKHYKQKIKFSVDFLVEIVIMDLIN